ncbi:MAG: hypothetical protein R3250_14355, partial [Melioribacteraceae bacterium]|nr:hypothetical protein [Melioribacteraceae bacterium]
VFKTDAIEPFKLYKKFIGINKESSIPTAILADSKDSLKYKISNWIRLNLFIPDAKIGWKYYAVREGLKIIKQEKPSIIFSSSPPPTVHLIAKELAKRTNIKWVSDFRDPWTDIHYYENQPRLNVANNIDKKYELEVLNKTDKITSISRLDIEEDFGKKVAINKCINLPNGFDEEDFSEIDTKMTNKNIFTMLHLGAVNNERNPVGLFKAIKNLKESGFIDSAVFQLLFVGNVDESIKEDVDEYRINDLIKFINYLPHKESLKYTEEAFVLILLVTSSIKNKRILPGKTFEYLRAQKYILCLGPRDGEVSRIIQELRAGNVVEYEDSEEIEKLIKQQFNAWHKDLADYIVDRESIQKYSRQNLTKALAKIFNDLTE